MMMSFCAVLFPRGVLGEILNLIESVSGGFPSYFCSAWIILHITVGLSPFLLCISFTLTHLYGDYRRFSETSRSNRTMAAVFNCLIIANQADGY